MVRLKVVQLFHPHAFHVFQFHYGTIKRQEEFKRFCRDIEFQFHYGTIKRAAGDGSRRSCTWFQFHYGTIKSENGKEVEDASGKFQFHYGTIKRVLQFNSEQTATVFQFHYGTIKSNSFSFPEPETQYFNSTMVRLKVWVFSLVCSHFAISIPLWYD